jgi:phosphatidylinositol alpha-1,6-mannosyltransferase
VITAHVDPSTADREVIEGVTVYRLPAFRLPKIPIAFNFPWLNYTFTPANISRIGTIMDTHNPDILHLHNHMFDLGLSAAWIRRRTGRPLVTTLHTVIRHSSWFYNLFLYPADRLFLRRLVIDASDQILCPDVNIKQYALEAFGRSDTIIIPYGVNLPEKTHPGREAELRALHRLGGKRIILSLGHVHEIRNRRDLISALPEILRVFPETVLLIVGQVSTNRPARLARSLGVEHAVIFTGPVPHQDIPVFLSMADLEAHWLNQEEPERTSLGVASLEAMLAGKAVISAANPDTYGTGILISGENIIFVKPGRPMDIARTIIGLLQDDASREAIGRRARDTIRENFSWQAVGLKTAQLYQRMIRNRISK